MSLISYRIQMLVLQRVMEKITWRSDHPWSAIFYVILYWSVGRLGDNGKVRERESHYQSHRKWTEISENASSRKQKSLKNVTLPMLVSS